MFELHKLCSDYNFKISDENKNLWLLEENIHYDRKTLQQECSVAPLTF
jgi:hypothetical protein